MTTDLIDHVATTVLGVFLAVWGIIKTDYGALGSGIGLLGIKGGVAIKNATRGTPPPTP